MKKYWYGEKSLANTFWLLWVLGSLITPFIFSILVVFISFLIGSPASMLLGVTTFLFLILFNPYYVFCWVSVWRSANQTKVKFLDILIKILVTLHVFLVLHSITNIPEAVKANF